MGEMEIQIPESSYKHLLSELKDIVVERVYNARIEQIQMKWEIGDTIVEELKDYHPNTNLIKRLSADIRVSESELYRCIKFREKFVTWDSVIARLPGGKNISWNKIRETILPDLPIGKLSLAFPQVEVLDKWGLIGWFSKHDSKDVAVVIKDPKYPGVALRVTQMKNVDSTAATPLQEAFSVIRDHYVKVKKWDPEGLASDDYARIHKTIKVLLLKAKGDIKKITDAIDWQSTHEYDWTIETVAKKWMDFIKETTIKPRIKPVEVRYETKDVFTGDPNIKALIKGIGAGGCVASK